MNTIFLHLLIILLILNYCTSETVCIETDTCISCADEHLNKEYCKDTNKMRQVLCNDGINQYEEWRSCQLSPEDEQIRVIMFQIATAIIGGISFWAVQRRKINSLSMFDTRKLRYYILHYSNSSVVIYNYIDIFSLSIKYIYSNLSMMMINLLHQ